MRSLEVKLQNIACQAFAMLLKSNVGPQILN